MKLELKLEDMVHTEFDFATPYRSQHKHKYEKVFTSGHRLVIYMLFSNYPYALAFYAPNGRAGEMINFRTAQNALDSFLDVFNTNARPELVEGFQF